MDLNQLKIMATTKTRKKTASTKKKAAPKSKKPTAAKKAKVTPEDRLATSALKFIDDAATLLRKGVTSGKNTAIDARQEAKKRAQTLLNRAHNDLGKALDLGASEARKVINRLGN